MAFPYKRRPHALPRGVLALLLLASPGLRGDDFEFFEKKIRPVLVERCYKCHSEQSEKLKGALRLDSREGMLKGGESGKPAVVPRHPEKSRLIEAIQYQNEDLQMPPKGRLSDEQVADFVQWISSGASDPRVASTTRPAAAPAASARHWAFSPPIDPQLPAVRNAKWVKTGVDQFILARLEEKGLAPSPPADKRTLIRRATYDLTGLPPTMEEVDAFLRDKSPGAFSVVVDRLLASPGYGERWGRHWLDVARYADTKGYVYTDREEGRFVHSHAYRDWVINAFNHDMPYDRFLLLQIAADQLVPSEGPGREDLAAMGFLTLGRRFLGVMHDIIDDRIDTMTRATQGLTVSCARCHDHKFDPISTRDYYSLYGVFAGSSEKTVSLSISPDSSEPYLTYERELKKREEKLQKTFEAKRDQLTSRLRGQTTNYLMAVLNVEKLPSEEFYAFISADDVNPVIVRQWQNYLFSKSRSFDPVFGVWHAFARLSPNEFSARAGSTWQEVTNEFAAKINPLVAEVFAGAIPRSMAEVASRYGEQLTRVNEKWKTSMASAKTNHAADAVVPLSPDEESLRQVLYGADSPVSVPNGAIVDLEWFFDESTRVELAKLQSEIDRWNINAAGAPPHAVILEDRPTQKNPRVFKRGNPANKGEEVPRQYLEIVAGTGRRPFERGSGRLEMARAIADPRNPLTARVMVNRIWMHHFGEGLVRTPSDFGTRCEAPTHPELLDYLAQRFVREGWSLKKLHRLILLSSVYQQASDLDDDGGKGRFMTASRKGENPAERARQLDPENRLLWRMNRQRLDFESMRDSLLAASGELDMKMGGRPVELFQTPFSRRRSVYGLVDRQFLPGVFRVFDFANPDMHSPERSETTVPQQALFFMNSPFVAERARALLSRPDVSRFELPRRRIERLYEIIYQRKPTKQQLNLSLAFVDGARSESMPEPPKPVISAWHYGYGDYDEAAARVRNFTALPHFSSGATAWQGSENYPDAKLGWIRLTAEGGHTGNDLQHAAVRRWVAPRAGTFSIEGTLKHEHKEGDGIRARIVSSRSGSLGNWTLHNGKAETKVETIEVSEGDTIDFVVDFNANLNNDDFLWAPVIKAKEKPATNEYAAEWSAKKEFGGPPVKPPIPLNAWEKYAQVLLLSNEFLFVD